MPQVVRDLRFKHPTMKAIQAEILDHALGSRDGVAWNEPSKLTDRHMALSALYLDAVAHVAVRAPKDAMRLLDWRYTTRGTASLYSSLISLSTMWRDRDEVDEEFMDPIDGELDVADWINNFGPGARYETEEIETTAASKGYRSFERLADVPDTAMTGYEKRDTPRGRCIYVIVCRTGRIKIGISSQPRRRIYSLLKSGGVQHTRIHVTEAFMNATEVEARFKRLFLERQIEGEWFKMTDTDALDWFMDQEWEHDSLENVEMDDAKDRRFHRGTEQFFRQAFPLTHSHKAA